ncbi:Asp23/Gls24 family envelope stress response protein [Herbiconiux sp. CPCC 205763]|uniref:Asp23/Gls24 family envelope stress response protein n=1 Tax=Herbiconiux aconitum TaxID=2970913 RepID=A0ABT2GVD0_9MICO|nr:Asp23/Gls24 family envelope stress response protein [Herbiconiux aconitum]MCS5720176.1 Asp23/Gls24 family envelope stress response protein [Herbiconiux aconitum]
MTDQHPDPEPKSWEPDDLDGHTIDELSDYLDRDRTPADPSIDSSPGCQLALTALERLRRVSASLLETQALTEPEPDESWIKGIVQNISRETRAGRTIPISHPDPIAELGITEGSVRGLVRAAGDSIDGIIIGRSTLHGDVTVPGTPITVTIDATVSWGSNIPQTTELLREAIIRTLELHTDLLIAGVDITVHDIHTPRP